MASTIPDTLPSRADTISLRGVRVHNLQSIDLDIPSGQLVVVCGVSGSGKTSLAIDSLYTEGQRRYIESFSAYTRQFLGRLEKPDADRIDGIPPAVAVTSSSGSHSSRATVATATETAEYLRLLLSRIGTVYCTDCGKPIRRDTPQAISERIGALPESTRLMVAFPLDIMASNHVDQLSSTLREDGYLRVVSGDRVITLDDQSLPAAESAAAPIEESPESEASENTEDPTVESKMRWPDKPDGEDEKVEDSEDETDEIMRTDWVIVDRIKSDADQGRIRDSLETAFAEGNSRCAVFLPEPTETAEPQAEWTQRGSMQEIDGRQWRRLTFGTDLRCDDCNLEFPTPEPRLLSFNSPLGACPTCEGFGNVIVLDMNRIVPDRKKTLRGGAIAPWCTPAHSHMLDKLVEQADELEVPLDVPFEELTDRQLAVVIRGTADKQFEGLDGFFAGLERRKYKMHVRVFLNRWRSARQCTTCGGARLRPEALAVRLGGKNIAEIMAMQIRQILPFFEELDITDHQRSIGRLMLDQIVGRLGYLDRVGLGYLNLDRPLKTLSGGERRRVALASSLGSNLVGMLYVLDEPSIGLHPRDIDRLIESIAGLRERGNTVVVVEHEESIIRSADQVIEIGPGAGDQGGRVVFDGTPAEMIADEDSLTGAYLAGRRGGSVPAKRRTPEHGWIQLVGATGNNLQEVTVEIPLGVLCLITGVSGAGKSTLVGGTLYPALCRRLRNDSPTTYPYEDILGDGQIDEVVLVDQSPIGRSPRSNPVTYLKAFDEIRAVFADTPDAKTRGYGASHFSFNVDGGRCPECKGDGFLRVDMQFLPDVFMKCASCGGTRYRPEVLDVTYRGRNIAEVLDMTAREAFTFFRGRPKVQARLKRLIDVGLDYVRLGQPANTLSGGEAQRLKLAGYMSAGKRGRCLFILDEPSTGLHFSDVVQLLDCFDTLLEVGHSLIVVEHNIQVMRAADYIIDLGPGAAEQGGQVVAEGTPEQVAESNTSITGQFLRDLLD